MFSYELLYFTPLIRYTMTLTRYTAFTLREHVTILERTKWPELTFHLKAVTAEEEPTLGAYSTHATLISESTHWRVIVIGHC